MGMRATTGNESPPVRGALSRFAGNGNWEWLQTPFFADSTSPLNEIVWFRLHCTWGDVMILMACAGGVTAIRRSARWLAGPGFLDVALLSCSCRVFRVGVVPLVQWVVLPTLAVILASRLARSRGG